MRTVIIIILDLTICLMSCASAHAMEMAPILDERDRARDKADQEYKVKLADADKKALTKLSSLTHSVKDTERIDVYKEMLRIDCKNEEAVKYFTALGTLDSVLLGLNKSDTPVVDTFVMPKTAQAWKDLKGIEYKIDPTKENIVPSSMGLKAGMKIRIVPHPTEGWKDSIVPDPNFGNWQTTCVVRTGSGTDAKQWTKLVDLKDMIYTVSDYDFMFKCDHNDFKSMVGTLPVKLILVK